MNYNSEVYLVEVYLKPLKIWLLENSDTNHFHINF